MEIELNELLEYPEKFKFVTVIRAGYEEFKDNQVFLEKKLGNKARGFFIGKSAYIIFEKNPNILVLIKKDKFNKEDFYLNNIEIDIQGKSRKKISGFYKMLKEDLKQYKLYIAILLVVYILIFCTNSTVIGLEKLNDMFIDIISIFIGMLFVFATMFYEKDELDESIRNGKAQELFMTDKYIFVLAMISLVCVIISNGVLNYEVSHSNIVYIKNYFKQNYYCIYWVLKYGVAQVLTGISIIFNYICFKSIIDYYLAKIQSRAINRQIKSIRDSIKNR